MLSTRVRSLVRNKIISDSLNHDASPDFCLVKRFKKALFEYLSDIYYSLAIPNKFIRRNDGLAI